MDAEPEPFAVSIKKAQTLLGDQSPFQHLRIARLRSAPRLERRRQNFDSRKFNQSLHGRPTARPNPATETAQPAFRSP